MSRNHAESAATKTSIEPNRPMSDATLTADGSVVALLKDGSEKSRYRIQSSDGGPRTCRKCGEPIPEGRGPRAEDCGLPKCKSKAYRLQKKAEADAMAAALAAKQADEKESKSANGLPIPIQDREPEQSPKPSAPSCDSIGATPSFQEVRLQPGQQSIVLVCGCGARTTIQISHTQAESESVQGTSPNKPESASAVAQPVASPVPIFG